MWDFRMCIWWSCNRSQGKVTYWKYVSEILGSFDCASWMLGEERETNKMQLTWCLSSDFYHNMFRAASCPSSGEQDRVLPHAGLCTRTPETCWDRSLMINIRLVASCWFLSVFTLHFKKLCEYRFYYYGDLYIFKLH